MARSDHGFSYEEWDDLAIQYGRQAGHVGCFGKTYNFSASRDGVSVYVPQRVFDRLVREGRIDPKGAVIEMPTGV